MTLRVCHLGKFYPPAPGGVETHVQTLARAQARAGAVVQVVCVNHRDASSTDVTWRPLGATPTVVESDRGVRVRRLGRRASVSRLDMCPSLLGTLWKLREERTDIVHVHAPNPTMFLALATLPPFSTLVVTHHSDVVKQRVLGRVFAPVERRVHERTALVLSTARPTPAARPSCGASAPRFEPCRSVWISLRSCARVLPRWSGKRVCVRRSGSRSGSR